MTSKPITNSSLDLAAAARLDAGDPLAAFAERFQVPDSTLIYLDGNSLGRAPLDTAKRLQRLVSYEWGERLIRSWDEGWLEAGERVGDAIGAASIGATPGQTLVADSTTVCLYKLASAALDARPGRAEIVTDVHNFPTDRYVLEGIAEQRGATIRWVEADPVQGPQAGDVAEALSERTALVTLSHVAYYSGAIAPMAEINRHAHAAGALTLWDLSHSAGSVPVRLDEAGADLAVGCTYKYLNGGPGAPAFLYVGREHQEELRQPIWGWLGRHDPFAMGPGYQPAAGIGSFISGTPPILGIHSVEEGVKLVAEAGIEAIRAKGIALTELAISLFDAWLEPLGFQLASPRDARVRGAHVAIDREDAADLCRMMIAAGVIPDFRTPSAIRLGMSPLTTRFSDVWNGLALLRELGSERRHEP